ncbi:MAG: IS1380 family transposase [Burkholderiales bacterium]|nr:IS1380 family transposase [Burkholderiales bacterium]
MPNCTEDRDLFGTVGRRQIEVGFDGGEVTSDAGLLLLRQVEQKLGLLKAAARVLPDPRNPHLIVHTTEQLLRQRVFGLCQGYEDLNDHDQLRLDPTLQTALDKRGKSAAAQHGASSPTLCRFEGRANRPAAVEVHRVLVEQFINSFTEPPQELILDFDATDDLVHGEQIGRHFSAYYDNYCFLPLYVFCGEQLLVAYLRSAKHDGALHAAAILKLLTDRLRQAWPQVRLVFRGDSGFCRPLLLSWCERHGVDYVIGLQKNSRLLSMAATSCAQAQAAFEQEGTTQRVFGEFTYQARSWRRSRRVIARIEHSAQGTNPRFIVTSLPEAPQVAYEWLYCARGEMENRIKECQLGLFADRTSCHLWWPNQFRLLLASLAYVLLERLRNVGLTGTEWARAQMGTLRCKLLKVGAVIVRNTRRIRFFISSAFPYRDIFLLVARRFAPSG